MEAVTKIDKAGRVVIPKEIRQHLKLEDDSSLLIAEASGGVVMLKKLDIKEIAKRLRQELKGVDVEAVASRVEAESNERARKKYKDFRR